MFWIFGVCMYIYSNITGSCMSWFMHVLVTATMTRISRAALAVHRVQEWNYTPSPAPVSGAIFVSDLVRSGVFVPSPFFSTPPISLSLSCLTSPCLPVLVFHTFILSLSPPISLLSLSPPPSPSSSSNLLSPLLAELSKPSDSWRCYIRQPSHP